MSASQREGLPFVRSTKFGVVRTKYGVVRPKRNERECKGTRHFGIQPMHAHRAAISGPHSQSRRNRRQSVALTRNPDAIGGNQWPSLAIPMQSVAPLTHRCSTKGIEPQLSMPPTPACDRAVSSTCRSGGYDLGTVIRGNQAPYSSTVLRGNQWQSGAVLKHCAQGQSVAIKRRTQALCSGAIRGNQAPYSSTVLGGNQGQSGAVLKHCARGQSVAISGNQSPITPVRHRRSHT